MGTRPRSPFRVGVLGALVVVLVAGASNGPVAVAKPSTSTTTAQEIWTNFKPSGNSYGFTETDTYEFDEFLALSFYSGPTVSGPSITCTGSATNCADSNTPTAPPPVQPSFPGVPRGDDCTFWTGGDLTDVTATYSKTISGANTRGNWTFTWVYTWSGAEVGSDDPEVEGDGEGVWAVASTLADDGGTAKVMFTGRIAGLSAQKTSKATGPKYSFSLLNSDGSPRIANAEVIVYQGVEEFSRQPVGSVVIDVADVDSDGNSIFTPFGIGAGQVLSQSMKRSGDTSILTTGDALWILNHDSFAGNDNGGSGGDALAYLQLAASSVYLPEGTFSVVLSAQVKGLDGSTLGTSVTVEKDLRIQGLGNC